MVNKECCRRPACVPRALLNCLIDFVCNWIALNLSHRGPFSRVTIAVTDLGREVMFIRVFLCSKLGSPTGQFNGWAPKCHAFPSGVAGDAWQWEYHRVLCSAQKELKSVNSFLQQVLLKDYSWYRGSAASKPTHPFPSPPRWPLPLWSIPCNRQQRKWISKKCHLMINTTGEKESIKGYGFNSK